MENNRTNLKNLPRRSFLKKLGWGTLAWVGLGYVKHFLESGDGIEETEKTEEIEGIKKRDEVEYPEPTVKADKEKKEYNLPSYLIGSKAADLNALYLGFAKNNSDIRGFIKGRRSVTLNDKINVNFRENLDLVLWNYKMSLGNNSSYEDAIRRQVLTYSQEKSTKLTLDDYLDEIKDSITYVKRHLNWDNGNLGMNIKGIYRLNDIKTRSGNLSRNQKKINELRKKRFKLAKEIVGKLDENHILSYGLTELMPSIDGKFNTNLLDFLLRNAGREYVEALPAMHDKKSSFGLYQFTSFALNDLTKDGASKVNQALSNEYKIPGSVNQLRRNDHHKAAYMFAIHNLFHVIGQLNETQIERLDRVYNNKMDEIVQYVATAHHLPVNARKSLKGWINNKFKDSYIDSCWPKTLRLYARKTERNLRALS